MAFSVKAVYGTNAFDVHNTVSAKLSGLAAPDSEDVFYGSYMVLKFTFSVALKDRRFLDQIEYFI
jgi:hypothetical protein